MLLSDFSIVTPYCAKASSCGYCKSTAGSRSYGMMAHLMTTKDYQKLINRGWRRSGRYLYKPDLRDSCCPQYTIRMKANEFEASKHQRQIINRFNTYVQDGDENFEKDIATRQQQWRGELQKASEGSGTTSSTLQHPDAPPETALLPVSSNSNDAAATSTPDTSASVPAKKPKGKKPPKNAPTDLGTRIRASEYLRYPEITSWKHHLRIKLEPSSFTEEKHALYVKYQMEVHHDPRSKCTKESFTNFLVHTPLTATKESNWTEEDPGFGSFHQCYYLDDKLVAVSVIDILPDCISAVYFYYDTDYSVLSLGKYSAQREIALVQSLNVKPGYEDLKYYYMGFYIFTCTKMTYKGQFYPSYLLDPETYNWVEFKKCQEIIKDQRYSCFENPIPMDPLFEAKLQSIIDKKKGASSVDSEDDESGAESKDEEDGSDWESVHEDDEEHDLYPDESSDKALLDLPGDDEGGSERKKKRLDKDEMKDSSETVAAKAAAIAAKQERSREMERVFRETVKMPPPGCLNPKEITQMDLLGVLCLTGQNALRPIVATDTYRNFKDAQKIVAEYYSYVGEEMGNNMILYIR